MSDRLPDVSSPASGAALRVVSTSSLEELRPHAAAWNALCLEAPQRMPTLSHAWASAWLATRVEPGETWRCHFAYAGDRLVGVLPVVRRRRGLLAGFELAPPRDHHTRSGDVLLAPSHARAAFAALLDAAFSADGRPFRLALSGVRAGSPTLEVLADRSPRGVLVRQPDERGSYVPVTGSVEEFRANLSDNFRRNVRKAGNRLEKTPGAAYVFQGGPDAKPEGLDAFLAVEGSGWKGEAGTAIEKDPALVAFYRALAQNLSALGWLVWNRVEVDGKAIAVHMGVRLGRALVLLKIAYDEAHARLSPGNCLFDKLIERELEEKTVDEVNCLTDMPWHRSWEMPQADFFDLWIYPRRPGALLVGVLPQRAKAVAKKIPFLVALAEKRKAARAAAAAPRPPPPPDSAPAPPPGAPSEDAP